MVCASCFLVYFCWASIQPFNYAPDELMRYDVTRFLFDHNRLPVGNELVSHWGFSYAHYPAVLCSQLGYVFMKIASLFTKNDNMLLLAARMVSVFCGTGTVYFNIRASKQLFYSPARWVLIVLVAAMPQAVFLYSYVNNDSVAVFGTAMIFYAWTLAMVEGWDYKNATLLAVGISVCALAYYNSYTWILCSMIFFLATSFIREKEHMGKTIKLAAYIVAVVLLLISYGFIRHLVLYNDLLGFKTCAYYGELYAIHELKPSVRTSLAEMGISFSTMLFGTGYNWFEISWKSFIGTFGYMTEWCPEIVYIIVTGIVFLGCIFALTKYLKSMIGQLDKNRMQSYFHLCLAICAVVTVILSIIQSYYRDFQPQGRYCYPALIPLAFATAKGYEYLLSKIRKNEHGYAIITLVCVAMICILLFVFFAVFLPSLK